jgi:type I restriction enzyme S subunit
MAGDWETSRLGDCVTHQKGFAFKSADYRPSGHPIVRVSNFTDRSIDMAECSYLDHDAVEQYEAYKLRHRDAVIATVGSWPTNPASVVGKTICVPEKAEAALLNQNAVRLRSKADLDQRFLFYLLKQPDFQTYIVGTAQGSASQASITLNDIFGFEFQRPPLAEQKAIAAVLGALDDKIELNRRMNATLEAMARALFQSWFVDFDPVRRNKEEGGRTKDEISALFPDSFQESPLGLIPKGWAVGRVAHVSDFSRSSINPGDFPDETFDHYSLPAFDEGRTPKAELGSAIMSNKLVVTRNSVLLSKLNPHIPRIWLPDLHATRRSVCSTEFIVASMRPGYSREFLFSLFTSAAFASTYGTLVTGTTGSHQRIRPESVLEIKTVIPPPKMVEAFTTIAKPMFDQINRNIDQSHTLATLRDTLLPKLLSGELSVADMKKNLP